MEGHICTRPKTAERSGCKRVTYLSKERGSGWVSCGLFLLQTGSYSIGKVLQISCCTPETAARTGPSKLFRTLFSIVRFMRATCYAMGGTDPESSGF